MIVWLIQVDDFHVGNFIKFFGFASFLPFFDFALTRYAQDERDSG